MTTGCRAGTRALAAFGLLLTLQAPVMAGPLASPWDHERAQARQPGLAARSCPAPPAPVHDLPAIMYYRDLAGSKIDDRRRRENRVIVKPLNAYTDLLLQQSDGFMQTGSPAQARCALELLHGWASAGALTGKLSPQGEFHRNWATNAFATAYLIVRDAADPDREKRLAVENWLATLCRLDQELAERTSNNHLAWTAASCASAGIASGQDELLDWAIATARRSLDEVTADGVLPREIARGAKALAYHNFTLEALVAAAEMALANGIDLYRHRDGALHRLADFVLRNAADSSEAQERAGVPQAWTGPGSGRFVWAEPYYRRFADPRLPVWLAALRPLRHAYFGGNATLMYGAPLPGMYGAPLPSEAEPLAARATELPDDQGK